LIKNREKYYTPKERPSGHDISERFREDKGGAIPPNLLQIPNTESNSQYLRCCKITGTNPHPARFPQNFPKFFIKFLTDTKDVVLDIFAGSNTTGAAAEKSGRKWIAFEINRTYLASSAFRFLDEFTKDEVRALYTELSSDTLIEPVTIPQKVQLQLPVEKHV